MKLVIEIPEKTNAHIRSDYGHGTKGLRDEDREILCDAIYHGTPYEDRSHGEWIRQKTVYGYDNTCECSLCGRVIYAPTADDLSDFPYCHCGASMRKEGEQNEHMYELHS